MKKVITILALAFSMTASAQKDTTAKDTVFTFTIREMSVLQKIIMDSHIMQNNKQLTGTELSNLLQWLADKNRVKFLEKKEQPKKD